MKLFKPKPPLHHSDDICEELVFTDEDRYFEEVFSNYLDKIIKPMMCNRTDIERYYEIKPLMRLLLFFLKEEMLLDNYFIDYTDFIKFASSKQSHKNRFLVSLGQRLPVTMVWALNIGSVYENIKPMVEHYKLENVITASGASNRILNKI